MTRTYESKLRMASLVGVLGAIAAGILGGRLARLGEPGENFWLVFPLLLAVGALAFVACVPWWRRVDDVQKGEHLASWWWGGMAGGIVVLMALIASNGTRGAMAQGAGLLMVGQAVGFLIWLGIRRLRRRDLAA
ncbi:MAG TPA: hypothetical protein VFS49_05910 [Croceibacterium sp.]|nr:hypothetical protein [Croceibacterium sp.]